MHTKYISYIHTCFAVIRGMFQHKVHRGLDSLLAPLELVVSGDGAAIRLDVHVIAVHGTNIAIIIYVIYCIIYYIQEIFV